MQRAASARQPTPLRRLARARDAVDARRKRGPPHARCAAARLTFDAPPLRLEPRGPSPGNSRLRRAPTRRGAYSFGAFAGSFLAAFFGGGGLMKASIFFASMLSSSRSPNLSRSFFCSASS